MSINNELADLAITRALINQRLANGLSAKVGKLYNDLINDLVKRLKTEDEVTLKRLKTIVADLKKQVQVNLPIYTELQEISLNEVNSTQKAMNKIIGADIFTSIPSESSILAIANTSLMSMGDRADTIQGWFSSLNEKMKQDIDTSIKQSILQGESVSNASNRLRNVLGKNSKYAETIARTGLAMVTNEARQKFYEENDEVIKGYEHLSTLDSRTTLICASRDGAVWDLNKKPLNSKAKGLPFLIPPLHPSCRSTLITVLKSWEELGVNIKEDIPPSKRASMDGQISSDIKFDDWLDSKPKEFQEEYLGKGRYELYKAGKITLKDLVNQQGRVLTIKQLIEKYE